MDYPFITAGSWNSDRWWIRSMLSQATVFAPSSKIHSKTSIYNKMKTLRSFLFMREFPIIRVFKRTKDCASRNAGSMVVTVSKEQLWSDAFPSITDLESMTCATSQCSNLLSYNLHKNRLQCLLLLSHLRILEHNSAVWHLPIISHWRFWNPNDTVQRVFSETGTNYLF